jgi:dTDP-L-rhamnose 4-epimerase
MNRGRAKQPARVLITGGAGFIGSRLALALLARGHSVRVLDTLSRQIHGDQPEDSALYRSIKDRVEFLRGSVCDAAAVRRALVGVETVVHLAAETGTGQSMYAIRHYSDVNVGGTALLLDVIANEKPPVRRLVVASSRAVYGEGAYHCAAHRRVFPAPRTAKAMAVGDFEVHCPECGVVVEMIPTAEDAAVVPHSVYGVTKLTQEQLTLAVGRAIGISAIALRYQNVYGPGQSLSNPYTGILSIFSTRIRNGKEINIFEDGTESRDFVYIDDVVTATIRSVEHAEPLVDVFNVGAGEATSVAAIASQLQSALGVEVPVTVSGQFRVGDIRHNVADLAKVRRVFGFEPTVPFVDGLAKFIQWVQDEQVQTDRYEQSLDELRAKGLFR